MSRGRKEEVELVEVDPDDTVDLFDLPAGPPAPAAPRSRWRRLRHAWPVAVVVVLLAAGYAVAEQRTAARTSALEQSNYYVADLSAAPVELWTVPGVVPGNGQLFGPAALLPRTPLLESGALLVQLTDTSQASFRLAGDLAAIDVATGAELWRVPGTGADSSCGSSVGRDGAEMVVCDRVTWADPEASPDVTGGGEPARVELELRDPATGELLAARDTSDGRVVAWGGELVVVEVDDDGVWLRLEGYDGALRWRFPYSGPDVDPGSLWLRAYGEQLVVSGPRQLVLDGEGRVTLDAAEIGLEASTGLAAMLLPRDDERFLLVRETGSGDGSAVEQPTSIVLDRDGTVLFEAPGLALGAWADDGAEPGVDVMWSVHGYEVWETGGTKALLELPGGSLPQIFLLHGAAIVTTDDELRAIGLRDGSTRWSVPHHGAQIAATDGDVVVLQDTSASPSLVARSVASGEELWRLELGHGQALVEVHDGNLFVFQDGNLVRFGS